jgi:hypothetical protein
MPSPALCAGEGRVRYCRDADPVSNSASRLCVAGLALRQSRPARSKRARLSRPSPAGRNGRRPLPRHGRGVKKRTSSSCRRFFLSPPPYPGGGLGWGSRCFSRAREHGARVCLAPASRSSGTNRNSEIPNRALEASTPESTLSRRPRRPSASPKTRERHVRNRLPSGGQRIASLEQCSPAGGTCVSALSEPTCFWFRLGRGERRKTAPTSS